jgi:hypothetical protein
MRLDYVRLLLDGSEENDAVSSPDRLGIPDVGDR